MKAIFVFLCALLLGSGAHAQVVRVSLQASGLTCSMCSKAVKNALEGVSFVEKVQVDIKNQQYNLTFKEGQTVDFDVLAKAVEDAGFSVASLLVTAQLPAPATLHKDEHVAVGGQTVHFLNGDGQSLSGTVSFHLVDKAFTSAKEHKKWSARSSMACVKTGRMAPCCQKGSETRIYHAII
ncbi:MAG: copper chaperone [Chitinophagaceae bacterium]|nr:MAG: copper chaperone [Chitinophagaceae bacterium]